mgnify:CR=1 FL=1
MKITITLNRSEKYVARKRLETGENVHHSVDVEVDVSTLPLDVREALLTAGGGEYQDCKYLAFTKQCVPTRWTSSCYYGRIDLVSDTDTPSSDDVTQAVRSALVELSEKREQYLVDHAERQRKEAARQAERQRKDAARELLADEIDRLKSQRDSYKADRATLAEFLAEIPEDAKRGTVKRLCTSAEAIEERQSQIEDASPVYIFHDDE